jgi:hypothetical protein
MCLKKKGILAMVLKKRGIPDICRNKKSELNKSFFKLVNKIYDINYSSMRHA